MEIKIRIFLFLLLIFKFSFCQENLYVKADNGLVIRENPNIKAGKKGKFKYGQKVVVERRTGINYSYLDKGKQINGEWIRVTAEINGEIKNGYVFSGFLTNKILKKRIELNFGDFMVELDHMEIVGSNSKRVLSNKSKIILELDLEESPEGKYFKINQKKYKKVEVYQRYENSITIMDEGPHCDLLDWKHFYSNWKKLPYLQLMNSYKSVKYSNEENQKFISININEFKKAVEEHCGERWSKLVEKVKNVNQYPSGVTKSKVFFKFLLTDNDNKTIEKIIEFILPMGC